MALLLEVWRPRVVWRRSTVYANWLTVQCGRLCVRVQGLGGKGEKSAKVGKTFTAKEVAAHCTPDDCWIIVSDKVGRLERSRFFLAPVHHRDFVSGWCAAPTRPAPNAGAAPLLTAPRTPVTCAGACSGAWSPLSFCSLSARASCVFGVGWGGGFALVSQPPVCVCVCVCLCACGRVCVGVSLPCVRHLAL
jgi:hypothetical protein